MSFAKWKKKSKLLSRFSCTGDLWGPLERLAQAAYKAGERQGRKDGRVMTISIYSESEEMKKFTQGLAYRK